MFPIINFKSHSMFVPRFLLAATAIFALLSFVLQYSLPVQANSPLSTVHPSTITDGDFFFVYNEDGKQEIWKSDGSAAGTALVKDMSFEQNSSVQTLKVVNKTLFFVVYRPSNSKLWRSDGTPVGTLPIHATEPGLTNISRLIDFNGVLFFYADKNGSKALWKSDGTDSGTIPVKTLDGYRAIGEMTVVGNLLYFVATNANLDIELWKSDGTAAGTVFIKVVKDPKSLMEVNGLLYFTAGDSDSHEIWKSDGTAQGTRAVTSLAPPLPWPPHGVLFDSYVGYLLKADNQLFFMHTYVSASNSYRNLNVLDITTRKVTWLMELDISFATHMEYVDGKLFFTYRNDTGGEEIWISDGTREGTVKLVNMSIFGAYVDPYGLQAINGNVLFVAYDAESGIELWKSDGTSEGTVSITDINTASTYFWISYLGGTQDVLFYNETKQGEWTLWRSDGTAVGTYPIPLVWPNKMLYLPFLKG